MLKNIFLKIYSSKLEPTKQTQLLKLLLNSKNKDDYHEGCVALYSIMTSEQGYTSFFEFIQNYIKNMVSSNSPRSPTSSDNDGGGSGSGSNSNSGRVSHRTATSTFPIVRKRFQQLSISEYTFVGMMNDLRPSMNSMNHHSSGNFGGTGNFGGSGSSGGLNHHPSSVMTTTMITNNTPSVSHHHSTNSSTTMTTTTAGMTMTTMTTTTTASSLSKLSLTQASNGHSSSQMNTISSTIALNTSSNMATNGHSNLHHNIHLHLQPSTSTSNDVLLVDVTSNNSDLENDDDYYRLSFDEYQLLDLFDILDVKGKGTITIESVYMFLCLFVCREGKLLTKFLYQFGGFVYDVFCGESQMQQVEDAQFQVYNHHHHQNNHHSPNKTSTTGIRGSLLNSSSGNSSHNSSSNSILSMMDQKLNGSHSNLLEGMTEEDESEDYYTDFEQWSQHEDLDLGYYSNKRNDFLKLAMLIGFDDMTIVNHVNELQNLILKNRAQKSKQINIVPSLKREDFMFIYYSVFKEFDNPNTRSSSSSSGNGVIKRKKRNLKKIPQNN
ncbi:hypothetical protein C9374_003092 [Naegleria lovaniensis]|uniref:EF-hand domain-containing protein n=1 Tax=Naegleria lovaniensis TaxID=51637 RepID=A0AA88KKN2_NAELO|nr:uncharacterized protein C9374_003092 [Naegleria lovaniensis]KAG2385943.1 hypothetical protein C9374_003092 [Naegleria lovaniensis]